MPTHNSGMEVNERVDQIAFKQALQEASSMLKSKGNNQATIEKLLEPGHALVRDDSFWLNMQHGLAVFLADGYFNRRPVQRCA